MTAHVFNHVYGVKWLFLTGVTLSVTAGHEVGALWAAAGVSARSEQTQVAAGSFTWILNCRHKERMNNVI